MASQADLAAQAGLSVAGIRGLTPEIADRIRGLSSSDGGVPLVLNVQGKEVASVAAGAWSLGNPSPITDHTHQVAVIFRRIHDATAQADEPTSVYMMYHDCVSRSRQERGRHGVYWVDEDGAKIDDRAKRSLVKQAAAIILGAKDELGLSDDTLVYLRVRWKGGIEQLACGENQQPFPEVVPTRRVPRPEGGAREVPGTAHIPTLKELAEIKA
ncbi:Uncharacterised protein [uncultured archaeon]|nr:Uncharacterised protein [uncultured archaeon]